MNKREAKRIARDIVGVHLQDWVAAEPLSELVANGTYDGVYTALKTRADADRVTAAILEIADSVILGSAAPLGWMSE